jgi:hypothetical protein
MDVLERSLREVLSLGNAANLAVPLQKTRPHPPLAELNRQAESDGTTADDDHGRIDAVHRAILARSGRSPARGPILLPDLVKTLTRTRAEADTSRSFF